MEGFTQQHDRDEVLIKEHTYDEDQAYQDPYENMNFSQTQQPSNEDGPPEDIYRAIRGRHQRMHQTYLERQRQQQHRQLPRSGSQEDEDSCSSMSYEDDDDETSDQPTVENEFASLEALLEVDRPDGGPPPPPKDANQPQSNFVSEIQVGHTSITEKVGTPGSSHLRASHGVVQAQGGIHAKDCDSILRHDRKVHLDNKVNHAEGSPLLGNGLSDSVRNSPYSQFLSTVRSSSTQSRWSESMVTNAWLPDDPGSKLQLLEKSRKFAMRKQSQVSRTQDIPSQPKARPRDSFVSTLTSGNPVVPSKRSIVGSRPMHWGSSSTGQPHNQRQASHEITTVARNGKRAKYLKDSLARPRSSLLPRTPCYMPGGIGTPLPYQSGGLLRLGLPIPAQPVMTGRGSFAPAFLAKPSVQVVEAPVDPVLDLSNDSASLPNRVLTSLSPRKPSRKRPPKASGPLLSKLRSVCESQNAEYLRLRSGHYPFSTSRLDRNDPRNHATSQMDVSLLKAPFALEGDDERAAAVGVVQAHESRRGGDCLPTGGRALICFKEHTVRECELKAGSTLRIYNAVFFAHRLQTLNAVANRKDGEDFDYIVICTQFCERVPSDLN